jgi:peptidoglycan/xylan/chitin deacetylase (PgdA/CDA1 family)
MNKIEVLSCAAIDLLTLPLLAMGGPITTVPWNGHPGAITFTYDDDAPTQLTIAMPALESHGLRGTFFVTDQGSFVTDRNLWIQAAQRGHEIANHTLTHQTLPGLSAEAVDSQVTFWADSLRLISPAIRALTMAYPVCAQDAPSEAIAAKSSFIARTCGGNPDIMAWNIEPNWMEAQSTMSNDGPGALAYFDGRIDAITGANGWYVILFHGLDGDWVPSASSSMIEYFDRAKSKNLWISTFEEVGAYWRSSFAMNKTTPVTTADGWTVAWTSPHPKLPPTVPLRVTLDKSYFGNAISVFQRGTKINAETDGSYVIDFMKLQLTVSRRTTNEANGLSQKSRNVATKSGSSIRLLSQAHGGNCLVVAQSTGACANELILYNVNGQRLHTNADSQ